MSKIKPPRRHDLDWLRVIAILLLLLFHVGMLFSTWGWHIKNPETSRTMTRIMYWMTLWRMPLLFVISGAGTHFALGFRSPKTYLKERQKRLLLPLLFAMIVIVPPQVYIERISNGADFANYLAYIPHMFDGGTYPAGNISWHHMWFVAYLLVYSLIALPLFLYIRKDSSKQLIDRLAGFLERPGMIYTLAIPLIIFQIIFRDKWPGMQNLVDDWANFTFYLSLFISGYLIASRPNLWDAIEKQRLISLLAGIILLAGIFLNWYWLGRYFNDVLGYIYQWTFSSLATWCWVLAFIGYGRRYLNFSNRFLQYANEGIYPFYILHQTVIIIVGYYAIEWPFGVWTKFAIVSLLSLVITVGIYELACRRLNVMRVLFGMKPRKSSQYPISRQKL